jgi:chromosome segregation ATPase
MISPNQPLPPLPSEDVVQSAIMLLTCLSDPAATRARLTELHEQESSVRAATAEAKAAYQAVEDAKTALADLHEREKAVREQQEAIDQTATRLHVASAAHASREQALDKREAELAKREGEIVAKEKALATQIAAYRRALA